MNKFFIFLILLVCCSCSEKDNERTAQQIINKSIEVSGGHLHDSSKVSFRFRDRNYVAYIKDGRKVLERQTTTDSLTITDVKTNMSFERFFNDNLIRLPDSVANRYANSVNSVHYFARLPYGLNDPAVNKELLGKVPLNGKDYYKIKVTFAEENGGEDFEDAYLYWFNTATLKPDFLAYEFHVDGGGIRFREAFNERYVNGIRFVDYRNFKADPDEVDFMKVDSLFEKGSLELLSKIELEAIEVIREH
ncbi:DUF6503 family protein [Allomuricauda sp. d1]|uniref:DUF6503 family protein n=1 Tax=Allomuricauda sp. d1 TaxID=3136725 RepID=UPI0031DD7CCC